LSALAMQTGHLEQAITWITDAIQIDPSQAEYHATLAEAYRLKGDEARSIAANRHAIQLEPRLTQAHANLAAAYYRQGDLRASAASYRELVRLEPEDSTARVALGRVLKSFGQVVEAEACFRQAAQMAPGNHVPLALLGLALLDQHKLEAARAALEQARAIAPQDASTRCNLGFVLKELHRLDEAEAEFRTAIALDPHMGAAHNNLGSLLLDQARFAESLVPLRTAIGLQPNSSETLYNLARTLNELGQLDDAVVAAHRAIELNPEFSYAYGTLASSLKNLGRLDDAIAAYRTALRLAPLDSVHRSGLIYTLNFHPGYEPSALFDEHREWGRLLADPLRESALPHRNERSADRRLRVGYVSAHFWNHAVNYFSEPLLAAHDHHAVEVFCYSNGAKPDEANQRLKSYADHWREIAQLSDEQASQLVRDDRIDILVDLSGHIAGHRLLLFARKPAPVQVTYLGYQNTTGIEAMDYRLTDEWSDPTGLTDAYYTEKLVRLSPAFFCYRPSPDARPVGPLPALANGYVTFGSFNNFAKVTPAVLTTWAELMRQVPQSRLVILAHAVPSLRAYVAEGFAAHGVDGDRVSVVNRCQRSEYLQHIAGVDIALDPFPFNGHTTTCDALWQGVPVVTLAGNTYASRFGSSAHVNLGLHELIAESPQQYVTIAANLASDLQRLQTLRSEMRGRMTASPLLDGPGFARQVEAAYRAMWINWCQTATP